MPKLLHTQPSANGHVSIPPLPGEEKPSPQQQVGRVKIGGKNPDGTIFIPGESADTATWTDVGKVIESTEWLIDDWIPHGYLSGSIAETKVGKSSYVLWGFVRPIIMGFDFYTGAKTEPRHVLWCDTEGSMGLTMDRIRQWGLPSKYLLTPYKDIFRKIDFNSQEDMDRIYDVVCRYEVPLVVVDSYRGAHDGEENSSGCKSGFQRFTVIVQGTKTAGHIIHHTGKLRPGVELTANNARGSNVYLAYVRTLIGIDIPDPGNDHMMATRRVRMLVENFGVAPDPLGWRFSGEGEPEGLVEMPVPGWPVKKEKIPDWKVAVAWLGLRMKPREWYDAAPIIAEGEAQGFSYTGTLATAKKVLGVKSKKVGKNSRWWRDDINGGQG